MNEDFSASDGVLGALPVWDDLGFMLGMLRLVGHGYSAAEIGARLSISPKTVDTYKQRIQEKLELTHRSQYVQLALRLGLLAED